MLHLLNLHFAGRLVRPAADVPRAAFYAYLTTTATDLGALQDIAFDYVVTNIGNGYNENHGVFVAPTSGTYVLTATLLSGGTLGTWGHFVVNGNVIANLYMHNAVYEQATQTVIVELNTGDDVSVQSTRLGAGISGDRYSSFSGFLLYPTEDTVAIIG